MKHSLKSTLLMLLTALSLPALAAGTDAKLYKNPNCGCCEEYAKYLKANGFNVTVIPTHDLALMQKENGVPEPLAGCHTTLINGYVFEGHIPADSVKRVLKEKPAIKGLSVPGMPAGSPGMVGKKQGPLNVYAISNEQPPKLYASY